MARRDSCGSKNVVVSDHRPDEEWQSKIVAWVRMLLGSLIEECMCHAKRMVNIVKHVFVCLFKCV